MSIINNMMVIVPLIEDQRKHVAVRAGMAGRGFGSQGYAPPLHAGPHPPETSRAKISAHFHVIAQPPAKNREKIDGLRQREGARASLGAGAGSAACRRARGMVAGLALLASIASAAAHSWYPWECCSDRDCFPVPASEVRTVAGGWQLADGTFIRWSEARPSPDNAFHICRREDGKGALIRDPGKPACFWAPMGAS